jgi:hypothetical protein
LAGFPSRNVTHRRWRAKYPPYVDSPRDRSAEDRRQPPGPRAPRFDLKYGMPGLTHNQMMTGIELYGQHIAPLVRELLT